MKLTALLVTLVTALSFSSFAQVPKVVKTKSRYLVEQYEVLATNDTLKTGRYRKYFRDGNKLLEEGQYDNNRRTGVWTFFNGEGKPELVYDYSSNRVLTNNRSTLDSMGIIQQADANALVRLMPPPIYLASTYQIGGILMRELRLPIHLQRAGITDLWCRPLITVSPNGAHYRAITSHNDKEFNKNAIQAMSIAFKDVQWLPGSFSGQPVTSIYQLPEIRLHAYAVIRMQTNP
jgi:hypothetical protein